MDYLANEVLLHEVVPQTSLQYLSMRNACSQILVDGVKHRGASSPVYYGNLCWGISQNNGSAFRYHNHDTGEETQTGVQLGYLPFSYAAAKLGVGSHKRI